MRLPPRLNTRRTLPLGLLTAVLLCPAGAADAAEGGITYTDVAAGGGAGITYERVPSPRIAIREASVALSPIPSSEFFQIRANFTPQKGRGNPGVAILDYDNDGDLDLYVTNGPGADNSLYSNQLVEIGETTFVDVGGPAGVGAFDMDSSGVCFGDIDNDGDHDLYVLGTGEPNRLFENQGDGTFLDVTAQAGVGGEGRHAVGCSFGDIDNDGLLDVVVANTYDSWDHRIPVFTVGPHYEQMEHNYLFRNLGGNQFEDVSATSGIENVSNMAGPGLTGGSFTWAIAMADVDQDGDIDILFADNQGGAPQDRTEERGWLRLYLNDGTGAFTEVTESVGLDVWGGWMGLDFGDFDCNGELDFFGTDLGFVSAPGLTQASRWFLRNPDGTYSDPGVGDLVMTPFGWGTSVFDYDNDGDSDIIYHGGVDLFSLLIEDNPGVLLRNSGDCSADFEYAPEAFATQHRARTVNGVAVGDLDADGFEDIVSVSNFNIVENNFLPFVGVFYPTGLGTPFDAISGFEIGFTSQVNPGFFTYLDPTTTNGDLSVELSSADNGNRWAEVRVRGSVGTVDGGTVNRDGIGAVVSFTPHGGNTAIRPILGGSSYSSQDSLAASLGLGARHHGTVDVLWPGGVRNRLHHVRRSERVTFPEIPCSIDTDDGVITYLLCVKRALHDLRNEGVLDRHETARFFGSALLGYLEER